MGRQAAVAASEVGGPWEPDSLARFDGGRVPDGQPRPNQLHGQKNGLGGDMHPVPDSAETVVDRQCLASGERVTIPDVPPRDAERWPWAVSDLDMVDAAWTVDVNVEAEPPSAS